MKGTSLNWFISYLSNRKQQTSFKGHKSDRIENNLGVPQGSVLGPLLFSLYINDVTTVINHASVNLFADDTLLTTSADNIDDAITKLNEDLINLSQWLKYNKLKLNIDKTKYMIIGNKKLATPSKVKIDGLCIEEVSTYKYLGVVLDNKMTFKHNLDYVAKKIAKKVGFLGRLSNKLTSSSILTIYKTIIAPHIDYCSTMLFMNTDSDLKKLQRLQNKAMRIILKCNKTTHINIMLDTLQFQSVKQRIYFNTLQMIYKIRNNMLPSYLGNLVAYNSDVHDRCLRRRSWFNIPFMKKAKSQRSVFHKGLNLFNGLPEELRKSRNICDFKRKCSNYLKKEY